MDFAHFDAVTAKLQYEREGYVIFRGVFNADEVADMKARFDAWRHDALSKHHATFVKGNHRVWCVRGWTRRRRGHEAGSARRSMAVVHG